MTRPALLVPATVRMLAVAAALLALGMTLGSCADTEEDAAPQPTATNGTPGATQSPSPTASLIASPSPSLAPGLTFTYTDPTYGYSFDYPATWYLSTPKENGGSNVILYSYDPSAAPGIGGPLPKDELKAIIRVQEGVDKPVDQWLAESRNIPGQPPSPTILSTSEVTLGGRGGLVEVSEYDGEKSVAYYLVMGGGRLLIIGVGPADSDVWPQFESVLASLRFPP